MNRKALKLWTYLLILVLLIAGLFTFNSHSVVSMDTQSEIVEGLAIEKLSNETYYFPALKPESNVYQYQPLKRFDLIFVGYDLNANHHVEGVKDLVLTIPGVYTHMLAYIGKDSEGFAYAVEMNADKDKSISLGVNGLNVGGQLYVFCLGSDYGFKDCPQDKYIYGIESYDFMWAKRLKPSLRAQLMQAESQLMQAVKEDLQNAHPFQLQFHLGVETSVSKQVPIVDDGRANGSDCSTYFTALFEEVAAVCLDDIRMSAKDWASYYLNHPLGQQAMIPQQYNPFGNQSMHIMDMLSTSGFSAVDNLPRQANCKDGRQVQGLTTPDLVFNSPSLIDVEGVERHREGLTYLETTPRAALLENNNPAVLY